ncbi:hypothetical protein [Bacillus subtilis]|uniref:hypothetical protein n=1 Tax=Bacillus subtilis TaxID=1423 RepID=UPI00103F726D|nr:hypothetical protein [Bacillus subtilis]QBJ83536.1 hypothetical protein DL538_16515 [Bacillus subtilis subsp. subtilis]
MKLYTDKPGEYLNFKKRTFYAWSKPSKGDTEITVIPETHIVREVYEPDRDGMCYLLRPDNYDFKNWEGAE